MNAIAEQILAASDRLSERLAALPPVGDLTALDPTRYCRSAWAEYLQLAARPGCVLIVGMNPGPRGMAQTGVPFTDPHVALELFPNGGIIVDPVPTPVGSWRHDSDRKSLKGRARREESAKRLWPLLREICAPYAATGPSADKIAEATQRVCRDVLLVNALPICWLDPTGKNVSAEEVDKRNRGHRLAHFAEQWLADLRRVVKPAAVIGVGRWAFDRVDASNGDDFIVGPCDLTRIKHPSPLAGSEAAWRAEAEPVLRRAVELSRAARHLANGPVRETREEYLERMKDPEGCEY